LESTGAVAWLSDTVPEPEEPPPQATRDTDARQRQAIPADTCVNRFRMKTKILETQQTWKERAIILVDAIDRIKEITDRLFTV
jgi:hypothetical protein